MQEGLMVPEEAVSPPASHNPREKESTSRNSEHTSQQHPLPLQERGIDQNDLNDDHCFNCGRTGELYCCDRCFRSFHRTCIVTKRFSRVWSCEYCNALHECEVCGRAERPEQESQELVQPSYVCTICFRCVHVECSGLPESLLKSQGYFFGGTYNFACRACLGKFGFRVIISIERMLIDDAETLFYFVNLNTRSPIHCGWFSESTLRQATKNSEVVLPREMSEVCEIPAIDKIVRMKVPLERKGDDMEEILDELLVYGGNRKKERRYGSEGNFFFLVVWEGSDFTRATWEDEAVLWSSHGEVQSACLPLTKYLLYRKLEYSLKQKNSLEPIQRLFNIYLPTPSVKPRHAQSHELAAHFRASLPGTPITYFLVGEGQGEQQEFFAKYLQEHFHNSLLGLPWLVIVEHTGLRWYKKIQEWCPQLNVVWLRGKEPNAYQIKRKEIFFEGLPQMRFQVLILQAQRWQKEKKFLGGRQLFFDTVLFDEGLPDNIQEEFESVDQSIKYQSKVYLVDKRRNNGRALLRHSGKKYIFVDPQQIYVYDLPANRLLNTDMKILSKMGNIDEELRGIARQDTVNHSSPHQYSLQQRLVFLRFVLSFGLNDPAAIMYERLIRYARGSFGVTSGGTEEMVSYTNRFMAALHQRGKIARDSLGFYFDEIQPEAVLKRICKLGRLKKAVEDARNDVRSFPYASPFRAYLSERVVEVEHWRAMHDYLLAAMIIEKGFGKWTEILQSCDWLKWARPCHFQAIAPDPQGKNIMAYRDYVRMVCVPGDGQSVTANRIEFHLSQRGKYLLELMG